MKFTEFIKNMYSADNAISSKRVHGSLGYIASIVYIGIFATELIPLLLITSAALLGLDSAIEYLKLKYNNK